VGEIRIKIGKITERLGSSEEEHNMSTLVIKGQKLASVSDKDYCFLNAPTPYRWYSKLWLYKADSGKYIVVRETWCQQGCNIHDVIEKERDYRTYSNEEDLIDALSGTSLWEKLLKNAGFKPKKKEIRIE